MADYIDAFSDTGPPIRLVPCSCCGRNFNFDTLSRHEKICSKVKSRKPFDSSKQRTEGIPLVKTGSKSSASELQTTKKNNWKQKHDEFISTIRSARQVTVAVKKGKPLPPPPPPTINPDYVQCPHCSRRFNEHAVERHVNFCKEQKSRIGKSPASSSTAAKKMAIRTQYKPPLPGKRGSSGVSPSSATKARQTSSKSATTTAEYAPSNYDDKPLPTSTRTTGGTSRMSPAASPGARRKAGSAGRATDGSRTSNMSRTTGSSSAGSRTRYASDDSNGLTGHYTTKHKTKDNYFDSLVDSDEDQQPITTAEVRHGRRAGSGKSRDSPTDYISSEHRDTAERATSGSSRSSGSGRRHVNVRDPSPTLFDDFGLADNGPTKNPFASRPQVHRPSSNEPRSQANALGGAKRLPKFCHECGTKYPVANAKFCCECGMKRLQMEF